MHVAVRTRMLLARHRWIRWVVVTTLAGGVGWAMYQSLAEVDRQQSQWGTATEVVIAANDLHPDGEVAVRRLAVPDAVLPPGALTEVPSDARLRRHVGRGEILTIGDISTAPGPAGHAEPGSAVVGIVDPLARSVSVGLHVRIASEGITLTEQAIVVGLVDDVVFVAVPDGDAAMVAAASHSGLASLIFLP